MASNGLSSSRGRGRSIDGSSRSSSRSSRSGSRDTGISDDGDSGSDSSTTRVAATARDDYDLSGDMDDEDDEGDEGDKGNKGDKGYKVSNMGNGPCPGCQEIQQDEGRRQADRAEEGASTVLPFLFFSLLHLPFLVAPRPPASSLLLWLVVPTQDHPNLEESSS